MEDDPRLQPDGARVGLNDAWGGHAYFDQNGLAGKVFKFLSDHVGEVDQIEIDFSGNAPIAKTRRELPERDVSIDGKTYKMRLFDVYGRGTPFDEIPGGEEIRREIEIFASGMPRIAPDKRWKRPSEPTTFEMALDRASVRIPFHDGKIAIYAEAWPHEGETRGWHTLTHICFDNVDESPSEIDLILEGGWHGRMHRLISEHPIATCFAGGLSMEQITIRHPDTLRIITIPNETMIDFDASRYGQEVEP